MTPAEPKPYRLAVHDDVLDDLRERLARTRWPDEIPESGWGYGTNLAFMRRLAAHWQDGFDWRAQEAKLNAFEQYRVPLDGLDLHFIHQPGIGPDPLPLLLVHGWPGSCGSSTSSSPGSPIRPGSAATRRSPSRSSPLAPRVHPFVPAGATAARHCRDGRPLLAADDRRPRLPRFAAQGGDWGGYIVGRLAHAHADELLGVHLNFLPVPLDMPFPTEVTAEDRA